MKPTKIRLITFCLLVSVQLFNPGAKASDSQRISFISDGKSRTLTVSFNDRTPNKICTDRTVTGQLRFTYVANSTTLTISRIEIYNGSPKQQVSVAAIMRVGKNRVLEGTTLVVPSGDTISSIKPSSWATIYDYYSIKVFKTAPMNWKDSPQMALTLEKSDRTGGTLLCNGEWLVGFLKK